MNALKNLKLFLPLAAALGLSIPAQAAEVTGGLKTGLNISDFVGSDASPASGTKAPRAGLAIGGYLVFPLQQASFKIQTECLITVKGATYKGDVLGSHYESRLKLTYLEIPVLARFDIKSRSGAKPAFLIGPSFGIKISARSESHAIGYSDTGNVENIKSFDPGVLIGGTVDVPAGRGAISLEARYTRSLTTISESTGGETPDIKNSVITILLGYRF
jgi:hypothetical protein